MSNKVQTNCIVRTPGEPVTVEASTTPTDPVVVSTEADTPTRPPEPPAYPDGEPEWLWKVGELYAWAQDSGLDVNEDMTKSAVWKAIKGERDED